MKHGPEQLDPETEAAVRLRRACILGLLVCTTGGAIAAPAMSEPRSIIIRSDAELNVSAYVEDLASGSTLGLGVGYFSELVAIAALGGYRRSRRR